MEFNLEYYRAFYYTAKFLSATKAAAALCLTQPALSRSIQKLEVRMGCRLFQRTPRGMFLTREGEVLYEHVAAAFQELTIGEQKVCKYTDQHTGNLFLGASETTLNHYLMPKLVAFHKRYPKIRIHVIGSITKDLWENLKTTQVEVALLISPLPEDVNCRLIPLRDFQDVFAAGPYYKELQHRVLAPAEILQYPIVCTEIGTAARKHLDHWFSERNITLEPEYSVRTSSLIVPFVENNLAIGVFPSEFLNYGLKRGTFFQLKTTEQLPPRKLYLAINDELPMSSVCREFIHSLTNEFLAT